MKNKGYLNCKRVDTAINRAKQALINFVKKNGLYENFGVDEVREIKERFVDTCDYSREMNLIRWKIDNFSNWCATYTVN